MTNVVLDPPPVNELPPTSKLKDWLYKLWVWVTKTLLGWLTFGGDPFTYSAAVLATSQSDAAAGKIVYFNGAPDFTYYQTASANSLTNNAFTVIGSWSAAVFNTNGRFNASTGVFTAAKSGVYDCRFSLGCVGATVAVASQMIVGWFINGSESAQQGASVAGGGTAVMRATGAHLLTVNAGDQITLRVFQNSGVALSLNGNSADCWIQIRQLLDVDLS